MELIDLLITFVPALLDLLEQIPGVGKYVAGLVLLVIFLVPVASGLASGVNRAIDRYAEKGEAPPAWLSRAAAVLNVIAVNLDRVGDALEQRKAAKLAAKASPPKA